MNGKTKSQQMKEIAETLVTAKDLATWIQKELDKNSKINPAWTTYISETNEWGSDGMSDGELLDYIYEVCKKITKEDNNESKD